MHLSGISYRSTEANQWEVPALVRVKLPFGRMAPFVSMGMTLRHISSIRQTTYTRRRPYGTIGNIAPELLNRNSFGGVAGIGFQFRKGPVLFTPEARYSRWANESFRFYDVLRSGLDQGDILLGVSF